MISAILIIILIHLLVFLLLAYSKPNYIYTKENDIVGSRIQFQKHKLKRKLEVFNEDFTEWQNMLKNNYDRIWDCGNRVFIWEQKEIYA